MKRTISLVLALILCLALAVPALADSEESMLLGDGSKVTMTSVLRVETSPDPENEQSEIPVWVIPTNGSVLTLKAAGMGGGLLVFMYPTREDYLQDNDDGLYLLFNPGTEGYMDFGIPETDSPWLDTSVWMSAALDVRGNKST